MTTSDIITLAIAIYGAFISTILGVKELRRERRSIKIMLQHVYPQEWATVVVVNNGFRPVTIESIGLSIQGEDPKYKNHYENIPFEGLIASDETRGNFPLPCKLDDGESVEIFLSDLIRDEVFGEQRKAKIYITDAEGNVYTKYKTMFKEARRGFITEKKW